MKTGKQHFKYEAGGNIRAGAIASVPAFLLCAVTLMILILDVLFPWMSDTQYIIFPAAIRIVSLAGIICMAVVFSTEMSNNSLRISASDIFFILFMLCAFISTAINGISRDAIFGMAYRYVGVYDLLIFIFVYRYCAGRISTEKIRYTFLLAFAALSDLLAAAFIYDQFNGSIAAFSNKAEPAAIYFHGNHYGYFLVMAVIVSAGLFLYEKGWMFAAGTASFIMNMAALALNRSMGSILAAGLVLIIMIILSVMKGGSERKKALILFAAGFAAVLAGLLLLESLRNDILQMLIEIKAILSGNNDLHAGNGRWGIWQYIAGFVAERPLWGYGCEGIADMMKGYTLTSSPHNEPLTYAAFFGIPAALLYCAAVQTSVIKGMKTDQYDDSCIKSAFAAQGYFVSYNFGVAMFYTAPFLFIFLGLSSGNSNE